MATFILHFLNDEPFNLNLSTLQFDQMQHQQLLQLLSNVLSWIFDSERVDIKREAAEETAIRILNSLRILRYRPPQDQEEQEEWRAGIVEGRKTSVYPLLVFLFENSDGLKERAYLAKYLMKTDVPGEFYDYDIEELQNEIGDLMTEFKEIHADVKSVMSDVLLLNDIKEDLKSMEKEKMILVRKIEKTEKKVQNIPYFDKQMQLASQLRGEKSRYAEMAHQKQLERQKVLNIESRINRMKINLNEAQAVADTLDEQALMEKLEDEVATNTYLVNGKLFQEIETKENKLRELSTMARSSSVKEDDITRMTEEIEEMTKRIRKLEDERDHKEVDIDENMSVFRHQVTLLERKKETAVQKLQELRQELAKVEKDVEERKHNLKDKVGGEVVSNVQESIGGEIVEVLNVPTKYDRPKTAAPQTNNSEDIKSDMKQMMNSLDERKDRITDQRARREEMRLMLSQKMDAINIMKRQREEQVAEMERNNRLLVESVRDLENTIEECGEKIPELKNELAILLDDKNSLEGASGDNLEEKVTLAAEKEQELDAQIEEMGDMDEMRLQGELWKDILTIFEVKMEIFKERSMSRH
ncbi:hypothetical protein GCK72_024403 [Caenorhabditis remanei]|uniref:Intraflagellar transport protein 81 homolog n=1 Tax=Caenorhabditis remanei TaxID=31234 RepID=A0A6A5FZ89_CAERE|nr:hypothetical protein GCK72_024403 [Caenorhabditis remanei]KAF1747937.1 hypothetical protein GCK72_024403 [Caenorhabditis remanei]